MAELANMKKIIKEQKIEIAGLKKKLEKATKKLAQRSLDCQICGKLLANKQCLK